MVIRCRCGATWTGRLAKIIAEYWEYVRESHSVRDTADHRFKSVRVAVGQTILGLTKHE
jgi:hypothetical protein